MLGVLNAEEIEQVLRDNVLGRVGCTDGLKAYVVPMTYVYDDGCVIGHTAEGLKIEILRKNPECCFEVDQMKSISNWQSVIAWGTFKELKGVEADNALEKITNKLLPLMPSETSLVARMGPISDKRTSTQFNNSIVYQITLKVKTGRYER